MTYSAHFSKKIACMALVCVGAILLAWAALVIVLSCDVPGFQARGQSQSGSDPVEAPTELEDASDDPVAFVACGHVGDLPVTYVRQTDSLLDRAWSPAALVRPPNHLNSI
jgi:hypothetical protein